MFLNFSSTQLLVLGVQLFLFKQTWPARKKYNTNTNTNTNNDNSSNNNNNNNKNNITCY